MNKKYLFIALGLWAGQSFAQSNNTLLDASFWKNNPAPAEVKAEIEKGNNPLESNRMNFDPIVFAILNGASSESVQILLDQKGVDINKLTHEGRTYLAWAALRGNFPVAKLLISKGANVNVVDEHGATPLSAAAGSDNNLEFVKALVDAGADLHKKYQNGADLLLVGVGNDKDLQLTDYLLTKGFSLQTTDANGATAFDYAARAGNLIVLKKLKERGVKHTKNALLMASQGTRRTSVPLDVYEYLISLGIDPKITNEDGQNVLHNIVRKQDQKEIISYFIGKGVDVNQADKEGNTPFMNAAAANKDVQVIELLLPKVKNINQKNNAGASALALAVQGNNADVVSLLLSKGADLQTKDVKGNSLAFYLLQSFRIGRGGMPPMGGAPQGARPGEAQKDDFTEKMNLLKEKGLNFTAPQEDGNSLLYLAAGKGSLDLLKKIQPLQLNVNAKNPEGMTALHKAALMAKDDSILQYLLSIGADKSIKDEMDETAYDLAKENKYLTNNKVSIDFLK